VPGIYALDRLPLARLRQKACLTLVPEEDSYINHIHADDLAGIVVAALRHAPPGRIYNVSDDSSLKMGEYFDLIADHFELARPHRITRAQAEGGLISQNLFSFMRESRRLMNKRMKRELHVSLRYPTVSSCLACSAPAGAESR
jgi:nucleoside-diphosphate-sugar epimerase